LEQIAENDDKGTEFLLVDALNLREKSLKLESCQRTIQKFIKDRWLEQTNSKLYFGVRTLLDLRTYLEDEFSTELQ
jgi:hypothetical protein